MKHEWRKHEKLIYIPKVTADIIEIPKMKYITISGVGNPNQEDFKERIKTLYTLSYAIRMMPKKGFTPEGYFEYTVYPLEGDWSSKQDINDINSEGLNKEELIYTIMIRQPDFVTQELFSKAWDMSRAKIKPDHAVSVKFVEKEAHRAVQLLHRGSYDSEPESFLKLNEFLENNELERMDAAWHREIYLRMDENDSSKNQTTLRYSIK